MDKGEGQMEASMVKLFTCRTAEWLTREAMQIHGGMGYAEETAVSRYFVDARVLSIFEGRRGNAGTQGDLLAADD
jgi:(2S)-methylsuccinyl-CoA dehydrogenase